MFCIRKRKAIAAENPSGEESLDFKVKGASEKLGIVRLRKVQQKIPR